MTEKTDTPAAEAAAAPSAEQPSDAVASEDTPMTDPKPDAPQPETRAADPQSLAGATRAQPHSRTPDAGQAQDPEADASRVREIERERVSTIYDLAGRLNLERGFAEDLVKRGTDR